MYRVLLTSFVSLIALSAAAQAPQQQAQQNVFTLGRIENITVTGRQDAEATNMSQGVASSEEMYTFDTTTLDRALNLVAGAFAANSGGSRNEQVYWVRGFDRFQVPLSIDGIRVYLPADNRLDAGLFLTADLAEVQVQKGYVSVMDGPGGMGGAINMVTRKPVEAFEWEARGGLEFGGAPSLNGGNAYGRVGTKQDRYYVQASGAYNKISRWSLPDGYTPTATENGGFRDHSMTRNWRVNLKAGFTPNDTDEYSISYTNQPGAKDAPFSVSDPVSTQRDWTWPYWDIQSVYFLSSTNVAENAKLKVKAYYNTFSNGLNSYDNANYNTQTTAKAFLSPYEDYAYGGNIEGDVDFGKIDTLKMSFFYRRDHHDETQTIFNFYPTIFTEPHQLNVEDTMSAAAENRFHITPNLDLLAGVSYDWRHLITAQDFVDPTTATGAGTFINYPLADGHAWNGQAALIYTLDDGSTLYANVSDRTRFPTIFDRFSTRFGGATSNPSLLPERATNYEIGGGTTFGAVKASASVYYSDVRNVIVSVPFTINGTISAQSQNVGNGKYYGAEATVDTRLADTLTGGLRYSYNKRDIHNPANALFQLTGVPSHQGFLYLTWQALPSLTITPNLMAASDRWTVTTNGALYYRTGAYAQGDLEADWQITPHLDLSLGARNLFDSNYQLTAGFPEQGRNFYLTLRIRS